MRLQPTPELLESLDYLHNSREMQNFRKWLRDVALTTMAEAIKTDKDVDVIRGQARALMELVDLMDRAPNERRRLETRRNGTQKPSTTGDPGRSH